MFNQVKIRKPKRSAFNLSHEKKMSLKMGGLYPIMMEEILPGDSFKVRSEVLMRFAPMISPIMHRVNVYTHYFFVPNRIIWENWKEFITGGEDGLSTKATPKITINESTKQYFAKGRLPDYLGIPPVKTGVTVNQNVSLNAFPFRAYQEIYNEYYRDQNLEQPVNFSKGDVVGGEEDQLTTIRTRAWEKDYFTSALPWTQRGGEVSSPLTHKYVSQDIVRDSNNNPMSGASEDLRTGPSSGSGQLVVGASNKVASLDNSENLGITINDLRSSVRLQEWLERNARAGSRYIEQILAHFGVRSSDARLQRPEYLGGGKSPVTISEVLNTTGQAQETGQTSTPLPQGNMAGHGISVGNINGFKKSFEEHGYVIGIMSVLPKTAYQDGIHRTWRKFDKLEYGWPEFANLGEQDITNVEISVDYNTADTNATVFGYQSRYAEYKYGCSNVAGDFRDNLSHWHMGRQLNPSTPLNEDFVKSDPRTDIFAVDDGSDHLYCQIYNSVKALRPLPYYGTPRL